VPAAGTAALDPNDTGGAEMNDTLFTTARTEMVELIAAYANFSADRTGRPTFSDGVMQVMGKVPRHEFVPAELRPLAYVDSPLPIGFEKTISQPFIVALMTDLLDVRPDHMVLEVGTGLGYQAAILCELAGRVFSVEIIEELATEARKRLMRQGYKNIELRIGDGSLGWAEHAPYDRIMVTAAPELIPPMLFGQLKPGGRMVIPAGIEDAQQLMLVEKEPSGRLKTKEVLPVRFSQLITSH
jgi:protein-L-isoaspartate(D-aspartate) O-methyltransferase